MAEEKRNTPSIRSSTLIELLFFHGLNLDLCDSSKGEATVLQRKRDQKGSVVRIANHWCVRYADWVITDDGQRIRKQGLTYKLSPVLQEHSRLKRPPEYVQELQKEFMERVNESLSSPQQCSTIAQFVNDVWMPYLEREGASSTATVYTYYWKHILQPRCGDTLIRDFSTADAQSVLEDVARRNPQMRRATLHKLNFHHEQQVQGGDSA